MTKIKKIEIEGYFGKGNFEWNLDPNVNILGGKNGSGKSTIFKLCYALLADEQIPEALDDKYSDLFGKLIVTFDNDWTLIWRKAKDSDAATIYVEDNKSFACRTDGVHEVFDSNGNQRDYSDLTNQVKVFLINSFEQHASKAAKYEQRPKSQPMNDPTMLDLMIKDQMDLRKTDFTRTMEDLADATTEDEARRLEYLRKYKKVYASLEHFLQDYDRPFNSDFNFKKNGQIVGIEGLSMGEKQILLLLLMISNTQESPCIFFMDEPDLSMHIDWKEILVTELNKLNPNMQIILSTHAPSVITGWHDKVKEVSQLIKQ